MSRRYDEYRPPLRTAGFLSLTSFICTSPRVQNMNGIFTESKFISFSLSYAILANIAFCNFSPALRTSSHWICHDHGTRTAEHTSTNTYLL
ncbi:hypothetical protein DAEQUDRAFT_732008 [Daedalea quercina L-15889]|uniref:Uncharacterized protein n=1 Tax=Daedalea quercina L-15889 TaxID=1314783 RepID=A0A165LVW8_9APHY|nr:hypothetical protein DAEQUDRAFT_732008 [Daedalea quercina L-15889]